MINEWLVWTGEVPENICNNIIEEGLKLKSDIGHIGDKNNGQADNNIRTSVVGWFEPKKVPWVVELIYHYVKIANCKSFGFDITHGIDGIQFSSYSEARSGRYDWHVDTFHTNPEPSDRKLSFCLQLSDPNTYSGGEFEFRGCSPLNQELFKPRGSILIFPSFYEHRVLPVTSGIRYSLVSWIEGPKWR